MLIALFALFTLPETIILLPLTVALSLVLLRLFFPDTSLVEAVRAIAEVIRAIFRRR
jgi:hypothetical protein